LCIGKNKKASSKLEIWRQDYLGYFEISKKLGIKFAYICILKNWG
jgi:hypothetical protein